MRSEDRKDMIQEFLGCCLLLIVVMFAAVVFTLAAAAVTKWVLGA